MAALKRTVCARTYAHHAGPALVRWLDEHAGEDYFRYRIGRKDYYVLGFRQRGAHADGTSAPGPALRPPARSAGYIERRGQG